MAIDPETNDLRAANAALLARVSELESERDDFARRNAELFVFQRVCSKLRSTLDVEELLAEVLRGIREALHFRRVMLLDVDDAVVRRRLVLDGERHPRPVFAPDPERDGVFDAIAVRDEPSIIGYAGDGAGPLRDGRGSYCAVPLHARDVVCGIIYADDYAEDAWLPAISEVQSQLLVDFARQAAIVIENARLYEDTRRVLVQTQHLALTDSLTGLANRRALEDLLDRELTAASRYGSSFAFVMLDLDDLKQINDGQGHAQGDGMLRKLAAILQRFSRKSDLVARISGDEFAMVMSQVDRSVAETAIDRLCTSCVNKTCASQSASRCTPATATPSRRSRTPPIARSTVPKRMEKTGSPSSSKVARASVAGSRFSRLHSLA